MTAEKSNKTEDKVNRKVLVIYEKATLCLFIGFHNSFVKDVQYDMKRTITLNGNKINMPKLIELRKQAIGQMDEEGILSARLDVDLLLEQALGVSALDIILEPGRDVSDREVTIFNALLQRRLIHEPISQILGRKDFWSLSFKVTGDCLTPRPDSETLIEAALKIINDRAAALRILDMGTGSGCLLLSLMVELPNSQGTAVDISEKALALARENAETLGLAPRCDFIQSDWADALPKNAIYDVIICNPPYISPEEAVELDRDVREYEPHIALFAEENGLKEYKRLAEIIPNLIKPGGYAFLEIGYKQAAAVVEIFKNTSINKVKVIKDLAGRDRCLALYF